MLSIPCTHLEHIARPEAALRRRIASRLAIQMHQLAQPDVFSDGQCAS